MIVSSTLSRIRPFTEADIPGVADLHRRVFRTADQSFPALEEAYRNYFTQVYLNNPWKDDDIESLVHAEENGRITGFLGVVPRRLKIGARSFLAAICSNFVVDAEARGLVGLMLMRKAFEGPQDVTIADESNAGSRQLWEGLGGTTSLLYSMRWVYPLRPCAFVTAVAQQKKFLPPIVTSIARPAARAVDTLLARIPAFRPAASRLTGEDLACDQLAAYLADIAEKELLHVEHDYRSLSWELQRAEQMQRHGRLQKVLVRTAVGEMAGCYVYYLRENGISEVVLLSTTKRFAQDVLDHLFHHAWQSGAKGLSGRIEPRMMHAFSARHCLLHCGPDWMLVHSRKPAMLCAFGNGEVSLSRLDGEWCMHFQ